MMDAEDMVVNKAFDSIEGAEADEQGSRKIPAAVGKPPASL
jgi:hypothetical protein